jgi:hypothetical protein
LKPQQLILLFFSNFAFSISCVGITLFMISTFRESKSRQKHKYYGRKYFKQHKLNTTPEPTPSACINPAPDKLPLHNLLFMSTRVPNLTFCRPLQPQKSPKFAKPRAWSASGPTPTSAASASTRASRLDMCRRAWWARRPPAEPSASS